jgi:pyrroline-5-carboxylate reductase
MKIENCHVGFVGFGHMAQILCKALENSRLIPRSQILFHRRDPAKSKKNEQDFGITATSLGHLMDKSDLILICVRPNQAEFALRDLAQLNPDTKMFVSVMAGIQLSFLQKHLGSKAQIVRTMPNIASSVAEGMTLLSFLGHPSIEFRSVVNLLFGAAGQTIEIAEQQMNIGCGMAGSGPAFVLELIDAMAKIGEKEGITYNKALKIAAQTFIGAAKLIQKGDLPRDLLQQIATPGGTTQAGLDVLHQEEIPKRFAAAIQAASLRSEQISSEYF